jgi:hypothetical protein
VHSAEIEISASSKTEGITRIYKYASRVIPFNSIGRVVGYISSRFMDLGELRVLRVAGGFKTSLQPGLEQV